ncbi:aminoacyl-histidine dipeptidase [Lonepinella sp. BR2919]|uniref:aminoacyl-histidine dipeptidase n=1 Tax=unclassified Lonepinella TaxID=2642006 RepID=UPI003F6DC9C1
MSDIQVLQPKRLWQWFDRLCAIPRPSHHEEKVAKFIVDWANEKGFFVERDQIGNVLIRKPATTGMENRQKVALQAHLDMVPQANEGSTHNFLTDPILPYVDGEWVKAKGTTLGSDNGVGLASALAVLDSEDLAHPELEVLCTMTEEAGMDGAHNLKANWLQSSLMINTDTEEIGEVYIGCAGGEDAKVSLPIQREKNTFTKTYQVSLKGLRGGHSGSEINTNRVNAIKLFARFLANIEQTQAFPFALAEIRGGSVRNAIPREAYTIVCVDDENALKTAVQNFQDFLQNELAIAEPKAIISVLSVDNPETIFDQASTHKAIHLLNALPNGVDRYSDVVDGVVETSSSIGVLKTEDDEVTGLILIRSLVESGKQYVASLLSSLASLCGATVTLSGNYPGWEPHPDTDILRLTQRIYAEILGVEPTIKVIHAGLECGLIKQAYPTMEIVSFGPTIENAHSPDEKVHIPAVQIYWELLTKVLANIPEQK